MVYFHYTSTYSSNNPIRSSLWSVEKRILYLHVCLVCWYNINARFCEILVVWVKIYCCVLTFCTVSHPKVGHRRCVNVSFLPAVFKASPSTLTQCDRSPCSPFQPGPLHSSPLQTPTMSSPQLSPRSATASPIGRPPSYHNGHHRPPPAQHKSPYQSEIHWFVCINVARIWCLKCNDSCGESVTEGESI